MEILLAAETVSSIFSMKSHQLPTTLEAISAQVISEYGELPPTTHPGSSLQTDGCELGELLIDGRTEGNEVGVTEGDAEGDGEGCELGDLLIDGRTEGRTEVEGTKVGGTDGDGEGRHRPHVSGHFFLTFWIEHRMSVPLRATQVQLFFPSKPSKLNL
jgi:hypothetical protein